MILRLKTDHLMGKASAHELLRYSLKINARPDSTPSIALFSSLSEHARLKHGCEGFAGVRDGMALRCTLL